MHGTDLDSRQNPAVRVRIYGRGSRETLWKVYLLLFRVYEYLSALLRGYVPCECLILMEAGRGNQSP